MTVATEKAMAAREKRLEFHVGVEVSASCRGVQSSLARNGQSLFKAY